MLKMAQILTSCGDRVCLVGPQRCGKTSLLFQYALACAENNGRTLFICPAPLDRLPLLNTADQSPPAQLLKTIKFQYPSTLRELVSIFDTIHLTKDEMPTCIMVDSLCHYFVAQQQSRWQDLAGDVAHTCAHLVDGVEFVGRQQSRSCSLIVSIGQPTSVRTELVKRWLPSIMEVVAAHGSSNSRNYSILHNKETIATYTVEDTQLYFL